MDSLYRRLQQVSKYLNYISMAALTFMMFLTVADVLLRAGGRPLIGTYEVVGLCLGIVIGFTMPTVSLDRAHVFMEIVLEKLGPKHKAILQTFTRILSILLFLIIGYNLFSVGNEIRLSGEVSPTIQLPLYPVAYGVGVCAFIESVVLVFDIVKIWRGQYE